VLKFRKVPAESLSLSADIELGSLRVSKEGATHQERRQQKKGGGCEGRRSGREGASRSEREARKRARGNACVCACADQSREQDGMKRHADSICCSAWMPGLTHDGGEVL